MTLLDGSLGLLTNKNYVLPQGVSLYTTCCFVCVQTLWFTVACTNMTLSHWTLTPMIDELLTSSGTESTGKKGLWMSLVNFTLYRIYAMQLAQFFC